jgi:hypothetical protein
MTRHADITPGESGWISAGSGVRGLPFTYSIRQEESQGRVIDRDSTARSARNSPRLLLGA